MEKKSKEIQIISFNINCFYIKHAYMYVYNMTTIPDFQDVTEVNIQDEATTVFSRAKQVRVNR